MVQSVTTVLTIGVERCNAFTKAVLSLQSDVPTPSPFSLRNNKTDESFTLMILEEDIIKQMKVLLLMILNEDKSDWQFGKSSIQIENKKVCHDLDEMR